MGGEAGGGARGVPFLAAVVDYLSPLSEHEIKAWLIRGYLTGDFGPMPVLEGPPLSRQLQYICDRLAPATQEKFKHATILALAEWRLQAHGLALVCELAYLASDIRATAAVPWLRTHLESNIWRSMDTEQAFRARGELVRALGAFSPLDEVRRVFSRLLTTNAEPRLGALLYMGLCKCAPDDWPAHLREFFEATDRAPNSFALDVIAHEFVRIVTVPTVLDHLSAMSILLRERLIMWLHGSGACTFSFFGDAVLARDARKRVTTRILEDDATSNLISQVTYLANENEIRRQGITATLNELRDEVVIH